MNSNQHSLKLKRAQIETFEAGRMKYGFLAKTLFLSMDLLYGKKKTLSKFKVLEMIARVPYQAWENIAYIAITHTSKKKSSKLARRIFDFVQDAREQQDNEQWHLFILEELIARQGVKENYFMFYVIPQIIAFFYYYISWMLYVIHPRLSYELNAHFEDHAEHEYMNFVQENPELEDEEYGGIYVDDYGNFSSLADLFRQIGLDERHHKEDSLLKMQAPRYSELEMDS